MYIITVRRITSGELLKQRNGLRIAAGYGSSPTTSSQFRLTTPSRGLTLEGLTVSYFLRASRMYDPDADGAVVRLADVEHHREADHLG